MGNPPDIVHVVTDMALGASYRPEVGPLKAAGIPKARRNSWYLDGDTDTYKKLTPAVRTELVRGPDRPDEKPDPQPRSTPQ